MSELLALMLFLPPALFVVFYVVLNYMVKGKNSICVVVLGDFGRSPRMQYHSLSLSKEGYQVDVVCYGGSKAHREVEEAESIQQHVMREVPAIFKYTPRLVNYVLKVVWQSIVMAFHLLLLPKFEHILIQNPPTIPTLAVAWLVCVLRGSTLITDWHNYGFTILGLTLGANHPLVRFSKWFESCFGRRSHLNICVTKAMREDLKSNWGISASVLYDRPSEIFKETGLETQHTLFQKLSGEYEIFQSSNKSAEGMTKFTQRKEGGEIERVDSRPALLISSTSWTEDEDFSILLAALEEYDTTAQEKGSLLPDLACVITGKGPQKEFYRGLLSQKKWNRVKVCLPWLEAADYPLLLGAADIGVCLHTSSSGLDLPMKVVDMFGCSLPVCALGFKCLSELVEDGTNGMVFKDSTELAKQLQTLLKGFPKNQAQLTTFRDNLRSSRSSRWHDNWKQVVLPILQGTTTTTTKKDS